MKLFLYHHQLGGSALLEAINKKLQQLCSKLNHRSLNYCASMRLFYAPGMAGSTFAEIAQAAVAPYCVLGGHKVANVEEILQELQTAVVFREDFGAHANPTFCDSPECNALVTEITSMIRSQFIHSESIYWVWFSQGHPFYPVFWDFAFLIECPPDAFLFVASCSD